MNRSPRPRKKTLADRIQKTIITTVFITAVTPTIFTLSHATQAFAESVTDEEILVTGQRLPQSVGLTPSNITLINAEDIARVQAKSIGDVFAYEPSVDVVNDGRYGIKSISVRGLEGNYVKIKVDNLDQPSNFDNGDLITSSRIDLDVDLIKRVEVIKGPASISQGSDAMGGTVLFQTKDPADFLASANKDSVGFVKTEYHSVSKASNLSLALANQTGNLESLLAVSTRRSQASRTFGEREDEDNTSANILGKVQYQLNENHHIGLQVEQSARDADATPLDPGVYDVYLYTNDESTRRRIGFKHQWDANNTFFDYMTWQVDYQEKEQRSNTFRQCSIASIGCRTGFAPQLKAYRYDESVNALDVQFNKTIIGDSIVQTMVYGLTYRDTDYANTNITWYDDNENGSYDRSRRYFYIPDTQGRSASVYFQNELAFFDQRLRLTPGIRHDRFALDPRTVDPNTYSDTDELLGYSASNEYTNYSESKTTLRLAALYSLSDQLKVYAQYSEGFKAPDFHQTYYSWANDRAGYKSEPNPGLEAEYSKSYEIGMRLTNSDKGSAEISFFTSDYDDFIDTVTDYSDPAYPLGIRRSINIKQATIKGIEFNSQLNLEQLANAPQGLSARVAGSYLNGEDGDNEPLIVINPWSALISINYDHPDQTWGLALKMNHVGGKRRSDVTTDDQFLPDSYTKTDLTAYLNPMHSLTLRVGVYNLGNARYQRWQEVRDLTEAEYSDIHTEPKRYYAFTALYSF